MLRPSRAPRRTQANLDSRCSSDSSRMTRSSVSGPRSMSAFLLPLRPNRCPHRTAHNQASRAPQPRHSLQSLHSSCWSRSWSKRLASSWPQAPLCRGNRTRLFCCFTNTDPNDRQGNMFALSASIHPRSKGHLANHVANCRISLMSPESVAAAALHVIAAHTRASRRRRPLPPLRTRHSRSAPKSGPERPPFLPYSWPRPSPAAGVAPARMTLDRAVNVMSRTRYRQFQHSREFRNAFLAPSSEFLHRARPRPGPSLRSVPAGTFGGLDAACARRGFCGYDGA